MTVTMDDAMGMLATGVSLAIVAKAAMTVTDALEQKKECRDSAPEVPKKSTKKSTRKSAKKTKKSTTKANLVPNVKTRKLDLSKFKVDIPSF